MAFQFEGFSAPNGTFVPDEVFDVLAPELSEAELRVLLYIIRRTFGFKKNADDISLKQMTDGITTREGRVLDRGTGLSKAGNARGVRGLVEKRIIVATRNRSVQRGDQATTYTLRFKEATSANGREGERHWPQHQPSPNIPSTKAESVPSTPVSTKETGGCLQRRQGGVYNVDTQETVWQQTDFNLSNIRKQYAAKNQNTNIQEQGRAAPTPTSSQQGSFEPVGSVLLRARPQQPASSETPEEAREAIRAYLKDIAASFNDQAPLESSVSRAYNLYEAAHLPLGEFLSQLLGVSSAVRDRQLKVKKLANGAKATMPYYFACLEGELGLRPKMVGNGADMRRPTEQSTVQWEVQEESAHFSTASASSLAVERGGRYPSPHTHSVTHPAPQVRVVRSGQSSMDARSASATLP